jgi:hypothetical protein
VGVTASAYSASDYPSNTLDGNMNGDINSWSVEGNNQWIAYELSQITTVSYVRFAFFADSQRYFDIQYSTNGTTWVNASSGLTSAANKANQFQTFSFTPVTTKYIRFLGHGSSVSGINGWNAIVETDINGFAVNLPTTPVTPQVCTPESSSTTCLNKCGDQTNNCGTSVSCTACAPNPPSTGEFTIYKSWDFESLNEDNDFTDSEIKNYFGEVEPDCSSCPPTNSIVSDKINGNTTKVMSIKDIANDLWHGWGGNIKMGNNYKEIYLSYNWKFSNEFNSTAGGKLPGLVGLPLDDEMGGVDSLNPRSGYGPYNIKMFKQGGRMISYHYDNTKSNSPWAPDEYLYNPIYFSNGTWYDITQRAILNTFTNGVANADGINEIWVDGKMIFKETGLKYVLVDSPTLQWNAFRLAHFYGGSDDSYKPLHDSYGYIDNIKIWTPVNDSTLGTRNTHNENYILPTPSEITNRNVFYDQLITTEGVLKNSEYGLGYYSPCVDEAYLIDAGAGRTVNYRVNWALGGGDFLYFYDGNRSDSRLIKRVDGYDIANNQTVTSTGRYMFVRFSTNQDEGPIDGFTGVITFN